MLKKRLEHWSSEGRELIMIENGIIGYEHVEPGVIEIGPMFVNPPHRRQGIGIQLVNLCKEVEGVHTVKVLIWLARDDVYQLMLKAGMKDVRRKGNHSYMEWHRGDE
jgi:GNAT superfamily N-acetyltransferase